MAFTDVWGVLYYFHFNIVVSWCNYLRLEKTRFFKGLFQILAFCQEVYIQALDVIPEEVLFALYLIFFLTFFIFIYIRRWITKWILGLSIVKNSIFDAWLSQLFSLIFLRLRGWDWSSLQNCVRLVIWFVYCKFLEAWRFTLGCCFVWQLDIAYAVHFGRVETCIMLCLLPIEHWNQSILTWIVINSCRRLILHCLLGR